MPKCQGTLGTGAPCNYNAKYGHYCGFHSQVATMPAGFDADRMKKMVVYNPLDQQLYESIPAGKNSWKWKKLSEKECRQRGFFEED